MFMNRLVISICLFFLFISCSKPKTNNVCIDNVLTEIHYHSNIEKQDYSLSNLVESLEIVQLDNKDVAIVPPSVVNVSDHYIGIRSRTSEPYKLFDKKGTYICQVGAYGQGAGEYVSMYGSQISEENGCIYITPYNATRILAYDFKGQYIDKKSIPLAYMTPKSQCYINNESKQVYVFCLSFKNTDRPVFWVQDFNGNVVKEIRTDLYQVKPDYSSEIWLSNNNSGVYAVHYTEFIKEKQDSLYYYNNSNNTFVPKFTIKDPSGQDEKRLFIYFDLPGCYCVDAETIQAGVHVHTDVVDEHFILVDKKTEEAKYCYLTNDALGGLRVDVQSSLLWFSDGYVTMMFEPGDLLNRLSERKQHSGVTDKELKTIEKLENKLSENDNCIVLYGKLKQS